jgi:hypothetical protein
MQPVDINIKTAGHNAAMSLQFSLYIDITSVLEDVHKSWTSFVDIPKIKSKNSK